MIRRAIRAATDALSDFRDPNPYRDGDPDLYRVWVAVDATTPSVSYFRNLHEVRQCLFARYRHAAVEGAEYRGERP